MSNGYHDAFDYGGGTGRRPAVQGRWNFFHIDASWTIARFIAGEYRVEERLTMTERRSRTLPFWPFNVHLWPKGGNSNRTQFVVCGRAHQFAPIDDCPACTVDEHEDTMSRFGYTLLGTHYYHAVKQESARRPGKTVTIWHQCERTPQNMNCKYCMGGVEPQLGYLGHMEFSYQDQGVIRKMSNHLHQFCACGGNISIFQLSCPACSQILADVDTSGLSDSEFQNLAVKGGQCRHCGTVSDTLRRHDRCGSCAQPRPLGVFNTDVRIRRPKGADNKWQPIEMEPILDGSGRPQHGDLNPAYVQAIQARGFSLGPLDLPAIYAPDPPAVMERNIRKRFPQLRRQLGAVADPNAVPRGLPALGTPGALPPALAALAGPPPQPAPLPAGMFGGQPAPAVNPVSAALTGTQTAPMTLPPGMAPAAAPRPAAPATSMALPPPIHQAAPPLGPSINDEDLDEDDLLAGLPTDDE